MYRTGCEVLCMNDFNLDWFSRKLSWGTRFGFTLYVNKNNQLKFSKLQKSNSSYAQVYEKLQVFFNTVVLNQIIYVSTEKKKIALAKSLLLFEENEGQYFIQMVNGRVPCDGRKEFLMTERKIFYIYKILFGHIKMPKPNSLSIDDGMGCPDKLSRMQNLCVSLTTLIAQDWFRYDHNNHMVRNLHPIKLAEALQNRLKCWWSEIYGLESTIYFETKLLSNPEIESLDLLSALAPCLTIINITRESQEFEPNEKLEIISSFLSLRNEILNIISQIKNWVVILRNSYQRIYMLESTPKYHLFHLKTIYKLLYSCENHEYSDRDLSGPILIKALLSIEHGIWLNLSEKWLRGNAHFNLENQKGPWQAEDFLVMGEIYLLFKEHKNLSNDYYQIRDIIFRYMSYGALAHPLFYHKADLFILNCHAFSASKPTPFTQALEEIIAEDCKLVHRRILFNDVNSIYFLKQFNNFMAGYAGVVQRVYFQIRLQIFKRILSLFRDDVWNSFSTDANLVEVCPFCIEELHEKNDKQLQNEIDSVNANILGLLPDKIEVLTRFESMYPFSSTYLKHPEIKRLLGIVEQILRMKQSEESYMKDLCDDVSIKQETKEMIDCSISSQLCNSIVDGLCTREVVWSDEGISLVKVLNHSRIFALVHEYMEYKAAFRKCGVPDRTIVVEGQKIPYHSSKVPEYFVEEIEAKKHVSSKGVKAIFCRLYREYNIELTLMENWRSSWVNVLTQIHPEVSVAPEIFFVHYFDKYLEKVIEEYLHNIEKNFGPPDLFLKIEERRLPVHRELIKCYSDLLDPNYFTKVLSDPWAKNDVINLDAAGLLPCDVIDRTDEELKLNLEGEEEVIYAVEPITLGGVLYFLFCLYNLEMEISIRRTLKEDFMRLMEYFYQERHLDDLSSKYEDPIYLRKLYDMRLQHVIKWMILRTEGVTRPNVNGIAGDISDLYLKFPLATQDDSFNQLKNMCKNVLSAFEAAKIRFPCDKFYLISLCQQKIYEKLDTITIQKYPRKDIQLYFRYKGEHLEEMKCTFDDFCKELPQTEAFVLGEKACALFRGNAFDYMKKELAAEMPFDYPAFNKCLSRLNFLLSYARIKQGSLTPEEEHILVSIVNIIPKKLPVIWLNNDASIKIKNSVISNWTILNKHLHTQIPFDIDFAPL